MKEEINPTKVAKVLKVIGQICTYIAGLLLGLGTASAMTIF